MSKIRLTSVQLNDLFLEYFYINPPHKTEKNAQDCREFHFDSLCPEKLDFIPC